MTLELAGIKWALFHNSIFLPLIAGLCGLVCYRLYRTKNSFSLLAAHVYAKQLLVNFSPVRQLAKALLSFIGLVFLFLALLGPQWSEKERVVIQQGRDLFIALDISRSMLAQDMIPNRLECAKNKVRVLLRNLVCERVGLILFSGSTFIQCPLTRDYSAFHMFLDQIDVETISSGTTAIDQAIDSALQAFEGMKGRKSKLLLILTDGEDFSRNLSGVKQKAQAAGITIFSLGVASKEGAPVPLFNSKGENIGHQKDDAGAVVISRLNGDLLRAMSQETGGTYLDVTANSDDVLALVSCIQKFEKETIEDKKVSYLEEQYPFFVAISFFCFAIEWLL